MRVREGGILGKALGLLFMSICLHFLYLLCVFELLGLGVVLVGKVPKGEASRARSRWRYARISEEVNSA